MVERFLYVFSFILIFIFVGLLLAALRTFFATKRDRDKIEWVYNQLKRAFTLIEKDDDDSIMAGLQIIISLSDPNVKFEALRRLNDLTHRPNPRIRSYAREAILKLVSPPDGLETAPDTPYED